jgi:hypothetical protein
MRNKNYKKNWQVKLAARFEENDALYFEQHQAFDKYYRERYGITYTEKIAKEREKKQMEEELNKLKRFLNPAQYPVY